MLLTFVHALCPKRSPLPALSPHSPHHVSQQLPHPRHRQHAAPTMLRVQKKRRPDDWEKINSRLSGRFLPMDPRDEILLDLLERPARESSLEEPTADGPPSHAFPGQQAHSTPRKWNKRAEAARKRWADPVYRAKMLEKRAEKRRRDEEASPRLEIGVMDSITLCDEDKAKAINAYARSNKIRSEKITAFHRNRRKWMENRLADTPANLTDDEIIIKKLAVKEQRRQSAFKRIRNIKMKEELANTEALYAIAHVSNPITLFSHDTALFDG